MDEIKSGLKVHKELGRCRRFLLRKDLLRKVKKCDGKLSNVLQTFQVCDRFIMRVICPTRCLQIRLMMDARFTQLADQKGLVKVRILRITGNRNQLMTSIGHTSWSMWPLLLTWYRYVRV